MAFVLNSRTQIGKYSFIGGINELVIKKSIHTIVDTATLKIPGLGRIVNVKGAVKDALNIIGIGAVNIVKQVPNSSVETATLFQEGDKVAIDLGYNGRLKNEFRGFVRRVNLTTPITIQMEGYAWQLRGQNILASWKAVTLREVLTRVIQGTDITLSPDIPLINLTNLHFTNVSGLDVLEYLKTKMLLTVYFADEVLYAGIEEGRTTIAANGTKNLLGLASVVYDIGYNCSQNQPDLKKRLGKDNKVRVRLKTAGKNGKHVLYEAGDIGGAITDRIIPFSSDPNYLQAAADAFLKKLKYDGFEGKITGFLEPYCQPGWKAVIKDKRNKGARAGSYFIPGIETTFGVKGAIRKVDISYKLDNQ
jgi:hypothetical protein